MNNLNTYLFLSLISFLTLTSCEKLDVLKDTPSCIKKERNKTVTITTDCTGTYLRFDGKDYKVCNLEKVSSVQNGATVTATFKKINECNGTGNFPPPCYLYHPFETWAEVTKIK